MRACQLALAISIVAAPVASVRADAVASVRADAVASVRADAVASVRADAVNERAARVQARSTAQASTRTIVLRPLTALPPRVTAPNADVGPQLAGAEHRSPQPDDVRLYPKPAGDDRNGRDRHRGERDLPMSRGRSTDDCGRDSSRYPRPAAGSPPVVVVNTGGTVVVIGAAPAAGCRCVRPDDCRHARSDRR